MTFGLRSISRGVRSAVVVFAVASTSLAAQAASSTRPVRQTPLQNMSAEARVTREQARATALARVPGGRVSSIELRRASGKLVYTALIVAPGNAKQRTEVVVDAMTGVVLSKRP